MESLEDIKKRMESLQRQRETALIASDPESAREFELYIQELETDMAERGIQPISPAEDSVKIPKVKTTKKPYVTDRATVVSRTGELLKMLRESQKKNNF